MKVAGEPALPLRPWQGLSSPPSAGIAGGEMLGPRGEWTYTPKMCVCVRVCVSVCSVVSDYL